MQALSFSVQLFTAPSVVVALATDGLLPMLLAALRDALDAAAGGPWPRRVVECVRAPLRHNRYSPILRDIEYVLAIGNVAAAAALAGDIRSDRHLAAAEALAHDPRAGQLIRQFSRELGRTQGADPHARRTAEHVVSYPSPFFILLFSTFFFYLLTLALNLTLLLL
ncbi:hypothetical protein T492DRAFT_242353 [Pavlovales sp. CCMP2436]|nr:hypothetical protein T492DRAFT_242353 [Pavlovales sp. CCMP2436]